MIKPICDFCGNELHEMGGLVFEMSAPDEKGQGTYKKKHKCVVCIDEEREGLNG